MKHIRFGGTGLRVSRLCLGTMTFGYQCDEALSRQILDAAADAGFTFIDTADIYPVGGGVETRGQTEEIIGRWLAGRRQEFVLASKCGGPMARGKWGASRKHIADSVEQSLRRLQTDYIDLFQIHFFDPDTPADETMRALEDLVRSGKVRYLGCSNYLAYQVMRANCTSHSVGAFPFVSIQPRYNLVYRTPEVELLPMAKDMGMAVIPYNPLAGGLLTGKHQPGAPTDGSRFTLGEAARLYQDRYWQEGMFETVGELRGLAEQAGVPLAELAIGWVLANPNVTAPIIGASSPGQLTAATNAVQNQLPADVLERLGQVTLKYLPT